MTVSLNFDTVAHSISQISISGVTIKDIDEIPESVSLITPVLFPQPSGWLDEAVATRLTFGTGGNEKMDFAYTLHYVFLFAELGSGVGQMSLYAPLIAKLKAILTAILTNDELSGLVDMQFNSLDGLGDVEDPVGKHYWGALFSLRCVEFAV